jgi:hypothetical protein
MDRGIVGKSVERPILASGFWILATFGGERQARAFSERSTRKIATKAAEFGSLL